MRERNDPATYGDLLDLEERMASKVDLLALEERLKREMRSLVSEEIRGAANGMMEHMTELLRPLGDAARTQDDKLAALATKHDDHIADAAVHKRPARARRS